MNARADCELGKLIDDYLSTFFHDEEGAERLLPEIMRLLPSDNAPADFHGLEEVLLEFGNSCGDDPNGSVDHCDLARSFLACLQSESYSFSMPIGWSSDAVEVSVGGRRGLALRSEEARDSDRRLCVLAGRIKATHWSSALRECSTVAEEFLGALMAVGVIQSRPWNPQNSPHLDPELSSVLLASNFEGVDWGDSYSLSWKEAQDIDRTFFCVPHALSELEARRPERDVFDARMQLACRPFRTPGIEARRLRCAARFLVKAWRSTDPGDAYLFMATCLEGLLVQGENAVSTRVADSVALILGRTTTERSELRTTCSRLYDVRSRYIHDGEYQGSEVHRRECLKLAGLVVLNEIRMLDPVPGVVDPD